MTRLEALVALCPPAGCIVEVGANHGRLARALGAIATERFPHCAPNRQGPWAIADGLRAFRAVDVAVFAGMGGHRMLRLIDQGCPIRQAILAQPLAGHGSLRQGLAARGWRIDAERLATRRGRIYECMRARPGEERSTGLHLAFGPRLLVGRDPLRERWLRGRLAYEQGLVRELEERAPDLAADHARRAAFLHRQLADPDQD